VPLPNDILQQMLAAAQNAAGGQWATFSSDVEDIAKDLLQRGAEIQQQLAAGQISQADAKIELDGVADATAMLGNYTDESVKLAAQKAINAALGVLQKAVLAAI
jgi:hypothetical protein